ncbi:uncharacterized protein [Antedon mediterranea]|uniref:uncharacterized protein n=1 Tax=Antedon mediterranea TaxID=105859 RepID=UPI003AF88D95
MQNQGKMQNQGMISTVKTEPTDIVTLTSTGQSAVVRDGKQVMISTPQGISQRQLVKPPQHLQFQQQVIRPKQPPNISITSKPQSLQPRITTQTATTRAQIITSSPRFVQRFQVPQTMANRNTSIAAIPVTQSMQIGSQELTRLPTSTVTFANPQNPQMKQAITEDIHTVKRSVQPLQGGVKQTAGKLNVPVVQPTAQSASQNILQLSQQTTLHQQNVAIQPAQLPSNQPFKAVVEKAVRHVTVLTPRSQNALIAKGQPPLQATQTPTNMIQKILIQQAVPSSSTRKIVNTSSAQPQIISQPRLFSHPNVISQPQVISQQQLNSLSPQTIQSQQISRQVAKGSSYQLPESTNISSLSPMPEDFHIKEEANEDPVSTIDYAITHNILCKQENIERKRKLVECDDKVSEPPVKVEKPNESEPVIQEQMSTGKAFKFFDKKKIESEKPEKCSSCDCQPHYYCSDCSMYMCRQCIKHHKIIPALKDHPLYTLDRNEEECMDGQKLCIDHDKFIEHYCKSCRTYNCEDCKSVLRCLINKHDVVPMKDAVDEFNASVTKSTKLAEEVKRKLKEKLDSISKQKSDLESNVTSCKKAIELQANELIKKVKRQVTEMNAVVDKNHYEMIKPVDDKCKDTFSMLNEVNMLTSSINKMINKPEEMEKFTSHNSTILTVKKRVSSPDFVNPITSIQQTFFPVSKLVELVNKEGIGKLVITKTGIYKVSKDDESITVTKGQPFAVKVIVAASSITFKLAITLENSSGNISATQVEYHGNGEYKINGECNIEGDWKMDIKDGDEHIEGSPVSIKVEPLGCVQTIYNIKDYKKDKKKHKVVDVMVDAGGLLLVSSDSKEVLKFDQSGTFIKRKKMSTNVGHMKQIGDGKMVYSDKQSNKNVVMCDKKFKTIRSFGEGVLKSPQGLALNTQSRIVYVADEDEHCVFKFNIDNGSLLGRIGSEGSEAGKMNQPKDVAVTMDGHVLVTEFGNNRIQMFNAEDKLIKILISYGEEDKIYGPCGITIDMDENLIVSSYHKLQLFDKNGTFIKRIDKDEDGLDVPAGVAAISNRSRKLAVADFASNNVKIFNY